MITKHFFKILFTFIGMIILGLIGIFLASHFDQKSGQQEMLNNTVAK
jgi:hypothetical protein